MELKLRFPLEVWSSMLFMHRSPFARTSCPETVNKSCKGHLVSCGFRRLKLHPPSYWMMLRSKIQWFMQITVPLANKPFSTYHASLNRISDFVYVILSASRQSYMPNSSLGAMIENASGHHPVVTHLEDKNAWQLERPQSKAFCPEGPWMGWVGSVGFREVRIFNPPSLLQASAYSRACYSAC